jgi:UDP-N-acetylmuramoyl-tripeptide--D-alanyl-D-alanine ligase
MFYLSLISYYLYLILKSKRSIHMLQQNSYDNSNRYIKWIKNNISKSFFITDLIFILFIVFSYLDINISYLLFFLIYLILILLYKAKNKDEQVKKPLVITARVKRIIFTLGLLYIIPILFNMDIYIIYVLMGLLMFLNFIIVYLVNIINIPIEKIVYLYYFNKAKGKLKRMSNLKVIGITGSYGKTSSKNILADILNIKYNALPTPLNYNTPYGLMLTINNKLDKFVEVLVAEMGACEVKQIKELCDFVKPKYGIITKIGLAHLESFGSEENIQKGKFELIESLPKDGIGVLNKDDDKQVSYKIKNNCKILWIGIDNKEADVYADDINTSYKGTTFNVIFKNDDNKYLFETKLLGKANIYNILAAIALGYELNISIEELQRAVRGVKAVEHRLELKKYNDINIIDDAYNSNPVGSKMALEVLNLMPGKKIIVTPGMIELGTKQYELNKLFGEYIADVCDEVILVGEKQTKPIYAGLLDKKYNKNNIHIINDVKAAFNLIDKLKDKETYVLLENDLPDIFNE